MAVIQLCVVFACLLITQAQDSPQILVTAPNVFRLDVDETVSVNIFDVAGPIPVNIYLQNYPTKGRIFSRVQTTVTSDKPGLTHVKVRARDITRKDSPRLFVYLIAESTAPGLRFRREVLVRVKNDGGHVFLHTDKPIYTPNQNVKVRVISLDEDLLPVNRSMQIDILDPQKVVAERFVNLGTSTGFIVRSFKIPPYPDNGNWTVAIKYGPELTVNRTVNFEIRKYVLPTFNVKVTVADDVILPNTPVISGYVQAEFSYGKGVRAAVEVMYGIIKDGNTTHLGTQKYNMGGGYVDFRAATNSLRDFGTNFTFPNINGARLYVFATVTEIATGQTETGENATAVFATSPYKFHFKKSSKYFKPGLPYDLKVLLTRPGGKPVPNMNLLVETTAVNARGEILPVTGNTHVLTTDRFGWFKDVLTCVVSSPGEGKLMRVNIRTNDPRLPSLQQANMDLIINAYQSPSNNVIQARVTQDTIRVGDRLNVDISTLGEYRPTVINYMVIARGKIIQQGKKEGLGPLSLFVTYDMVPSTRIVVYYILKGSRGSAQEIVADALWVDVEDECKNRVAITSGTNMYRPGDNVTLVVRAEPGSVVGLTAVDKAIYFLKNNDLLTSRKMFKRMSEDDLGCGVGGGTDGSGVFKDAGLTVVSNAAVEGVERETLGCDRSQVNTRLRRAASRSRGRSRGRSSSVRTDEDCCTLGRESARMRNPRNSCYSLTRRLLPRGVRRECRRIFIGCCEDASTTTTTTTAMPSLPEPDESRSSPYNRNTKRGRFGSANDIDEDVSAILSRTDFPETWLFEELNIPGNGVSETTLSIPHSITTWVVQGVGVSGTAGMCVAAPHQITVFRDFFVQLSLPYSVIRGEQIEVQATVYNYSPREIPVTIYMLGVEGVCSGASPGQRTESKYLRVPAHDAVAVTYPVVPLNNGEFPIRIQAFTMGTGDIIEKKLKVVPEGVEKVKTTTVVLDPMGEMKRRGWLNTSHTEHVIDPDTLQQFDTIDLRLPEEAVEGSEASVVSVIGDILGPTVKTVTEGMKQMLDLPTGCGEQTLIRLAPTIYSMVYLKHTGKMTPELDLKGYKYITEGYKTELKFRKKNGSYGIWRRYPSSTWLTAFVIKVFCQAREFIFVDESVICSAMSWLAKQQLPSGSFKENKPVVHKEMMGGVTDVDPSLTAFVLTSLLECDCKQNRTDRNRMVRKATVYLESQVQSIKRPYTMAITAYALAKAKSHMRFFADVRLKQMSTLDRESNTRYWRVDPSTLPQHRVPYWYRKAPSAISIETASYALLTQLQNNDTDYSKAIVTWLMQQRNAKGAFISTQDTVVGLQALSKFSVCTASLDLMMECTISSEVDPTFEERVAINKQRSQVDHNVVVPSGGRLMVDTRGTGVGQLQVEVRFNSPVTRDELCRFNLSVTSGEGVVTQPRPTRPPAGVMYLPTARPRMGGNSDERSARSVYGSRSHFRSRSRSRMGSPQQPDPNAEPETRSGISSYVVTVNVCTRSLKPGGTGMSILEVGLFTGFVAVEEDLKKLEGAPNHLVQKYEPSDRKVILYLERVPYDRSYCLSFRTKRLHQVGKTQPVAVKVYDYYEPNENCVEFYHPDRGSPLLDVVCSGDTCICAAGKCSKCYGFENGWESPKPITDLLNLACNFKDYVYKVRITQWSISGGFEILTGVVQWVIKKGPHDFVADRTITIVKKTSCGMCPVLEENEIYILIGRMGPKRTDPQGNTRYRYQLDDSTYVEKWRTAHDMLAARLINKCPS